MVWLYVLGGVVLLLLLIIFCPVGVRILYDGAFRLYLTFGFIRIKLVPKREKKIKLRDYSPEAMAKKERKTAKKEAKKAKKGGEKATEKKENEFTKKIKDKDKRGDFISQLLDMLNIVLEAFAKRLKIKVARLDITVGGDDPAQTAIRYGAFCSCAQQTAVILSQFTNFNKKNNTSITVVPDFLAEKTRIAADIYFTVRVGQIFGFLFEIRGVIKKIIDLI